MESKKDKVEIKRLAKLAKVFKGAFIDEAILDVSGGISYLTPDTIEFTGLTLNSNTKYAPVASIESDKIITSAGDILVCITLDGIKWYQLSDADPKALPGQGIVVIRSTSAAYISTYFSSEQGKQALKNIESRWNISKQFNSYLFDQLNKFKVPIIHTGSLLDLSDLSIMDADEEDLKKLSDELLKFKSSIESIENDRRARELFFGDFGPINLCSYRLESTQLDLFSDDITDAEGQREFLKEKFEKRKERLDKFNPDLNSESESAKNNEQHKQLNDALGIEPDYLFKEDIAIPVNEQGVTELVNDEVQTLKNELNRLDHSAFILFKEFLEERFKKIQEQLKEVSGKLDDVLSILQGLQNEISQIKALPRDEEERLSRIYIKLDEKVESLLKRDQKSHEMYIEEIKKWFDFWDELDRSSKSFLPSAEFLYDEIFKMKEAADFSPFVIQYCRTLENEILKKLFVAFHEELLLKGVKRDELVQSSLCISRYKSFAESVLNDNREYTLGTMRYIMSQLREEYESYQQSLLLQSLKAFIRRYFEENVLEQSFLNSINTITYEFRNKAAHPHILDLQVAKECQVILRKCLIHFMSSRKVGKSLPA